MKCVLCSYQFDETAKRKGYSGCGGCSGCNVIKCPRCGYGTLPEPKWAKRLAEVFKREKQNENVK